MTTEEKGKPRQKGELRNTIDKPANTVEIHFWKSGLRDQKMQGADDWKESEPDVQYFLTQAREEGVTHGGGQLGKSKGQSSQDQVWERDEGQNSMTQK